MSAWKFVARERELFQLDMALQKALSGRGTIVFVTGEAGAGKTTLVTEFTRRAQADYPNLLVAQGFCKMQNIPDPYLPFREVLGLLTGDVEDSLVQGIITAENAKRLKAGYAAATQALTDLGSALIDNFIAKDELIVRGQALGDDNQPWLDDLQRVGSAENQSDLTQEIIFEQYSAVLQALAQQQPIIICLDNLQWADASSMNLLLHVGDAIVGKSAILIIGSYRPEQITLQKEFPCTIDDVVQEFESFLGEVEINLDSASEIDRLTFIDALLDIVPNRLDESFRRALFKHTGGQPLFIIELIENMQARGELVTDEDGSWIASSTLNWEVLPQKVEDLLEERISHLDPAIQKILAAASVEGQEFTLEVVAQASALTPETVTRQLHSEHTQNLHLVLFWGYQRLGTRNISLYQFRHNLIQKYLYANLSATERMKLHQAVGLALAELYGRQTESIAVELAWHFQQAGQAKQALEYLQIMADRAARMYAYPEAIVYYKQALETAVQADADHPVLNYLYTQLGRTLELNTQFEQALATYQEMERLAQKMGNGRLELAALNAQIAILATPTAVFDSVQGRNLAERALALARELGDRPAETQVLWNLCTLCGSEGNYEDSIRYGEQGLALARELNLTEQIALFLNDLSRPYGLSGHSDLALAKLHEAIPLWRELNNLPMLADSLNSASYQHVRRGEFEPSITFAAEALQISESTHNIWGQSFSQMAIGRVYWERGECDQAIAIMEKSIHLGKNIGFMVPQFYTQADLAAVYGSLGAVELGIATVQRAFAETGISGYDLHLYALGTLAQLQLLQDDLEAARTTLAQAGKNQSLETISLFNIPVQFAAVMLGIKQGNSGALDKVEKLVSWLRQSGFGLWLPEALFWQSKALETLGQNDEARDYLMSAREEAEALKSRRLLWPILLSLSQSEQDPIEAKYLRQQAREIVIYIADHIPTHDLRTSFMSLPEVHNLLHEAAS